MANELPWSERVNMLSINPEAAHISDIEKMTSDLLDAMLYINDLEEFIDRIWPMVTDNDGLETANHERYLKEKARRSKIQVNP